MNQNCFFLEADLKRKWSTIILVLYLLLALCGLPSHASEKQDVYRVSAYSPIREGDIAEAQNSAVTAAKEKAIEVALRKIVPEKTFRTLLPLLEVKVFPKFDTFIANYKITNQDVSNLAYTVHISATVDLDLLRKYLTSLGIIKGPGSHPLAVVYVTLDVPAGLDHVKNLGLLATEIVSKNLEKSVATVIPIHPDDEFGFRFIRPPQLRENLLTEGREAMADLAAGIIFQVNDEANWDGNLSSTPLKVSLQWADLATETIASVHFSEVVVNLESEEIGPSNKELIRTLSVLSDNLGSDIQASLGNLEVPRKEHHLSIKGPVSTPVYREFVYGLLSRLGEASDLIPSRFARDEIEMKLWTIKSPEEIGSILDDLKLFGSTIQWELISGEFHLTLSDDGVEAQGVRELGEEIYFYKRLPVPGVENPEDLKKIELVLWQEEEENGTMPRANMAPIGMGILGRIDPSRDHDLFRFEIPRGAVEISVLVEQTGPNEVQPRVRMFDSSGKLFKDTKARGRGRNTYFSFSINPEIQEIVLSVEDNLNRYTSMFPYVLTVGVKIAEKEDDEPS
jgi:hypothetical protein